MKKRPRAPAPRASRQAGKALMASVAITLLLYLVPYGRFVAYPLMLLSTLFHELGHGLAALATGQQFDSLVIYPDGSGVARHSGSPSALAAALIAAGGLVGPAMVAALGFALGRYARLARLLLALAALGLAAVMVLFVRNRFGWAFTGVVVVGLAYVSWRRAAQAQLLAVFVAVQLALSVFSRADYLFTDVAVTGGGTMPSDVAVMGHALGGPFWLWGLVCGGFSLMVVLGGLAWFWRVFEVERSAR